MKLLPIRKRVVVRPLAPPEITDSGLIKVQHAKPEQVGRVLSVADGVTEVEPDDTVLFSWQSGQELWIGSPPERVLVMNEADVLCIVGVGVDVQAHEPIRA